MKTNNFLDDSVGLIAGNRDFPLIFSEEFKKRHPEKKLIVAAVSGDTDSRIKKYADEIFYFSIGELQKSSEYFKRNGVKKIIMLGQVNPLYVFLTKNKWDAAAKEIEKEITDFRPHTIVSKIINYYENLGFTFLDTTFCMESCLAGEGLLNNVSIPDNFMDEVFACTNLARKIAQVDVGQTVVFKDRVVVAIEALEGTDKTIIRGYKLFGKGNVVVKSAKHDQDLRFDIPIIGDKTIEILKKTKAKALIVHSGKTIFLNKDKVFNLSRKMQLPIIGLK